MFIFTAKLHRGKVLVLAIAFVLFTATLMGTAALANQDTTASAVVSPKGVKDNDDRIAYLEAYGWAVSPEAVTVEELMIPEEFDETYSQYLDLQTSQGFDLTDYCGERVKRYTYTVTNYPTGESGVQAGLLIYKNTVIGGDVLSPQIGGFIHGLEYPGA